MNKRMMVAGAMMLAMAGCHKSAAPSDEEALRNAADALEQGGAPPVAPAQGTAEAQHIDCSGRKADPAATNDVLGVTVGMGAQEAYERLACANSAFTVEFPSSGGFDLPDIPGAQRPRRFLTADAGTEKVWAYLIGLPGQEKVYAIFHNIDFGEGKEPPVETLYQSLAAKYGKGVQHVAYAGPIITVAHSPTGALLGAESADFTRCMGNPRTQSVSVSDACGFTVDYEVEPKKANPGLAQRLFLSVADQRAAMQAIEAYKAYASGAVERQKADELQRAQDAVRNAGGDKSRVPTL